MEELGRSKFVVLGKPMRDFGFPDHQRYFASVAEAVSFEDDDEARGLVQGRRRRIRTLVLRRATGLRYVGLEMLVRACGKSVEAIDAVFTFVCKMEPMRVMDTMLVSHVRILSIRSLLARSPELQSIKVPPVQRFLEKTTSGRSRSSSRGSSPGRSPIHHDSVTRFSLVDEHVFSEHKDTWRQHVTGGKLRKITEEAKSFAIGNKSLAALFFILLLVSCSEILDHGLPRTSTSFLLLEKLFDRLAKASSAGSSEVSSPFSSGKLLGQSREPERLTATNTKGPSPEAVTVPRAVDKVETLVALVKSGNEKVKSTPAGEYLTAALNNLDPEQYDNVAVISDGAGILVLDLMMEVSDADMAATS